VAHLQVSRLAEDGQGRFLAHDGLEALPGAVPVDKEDDLRTYALQCAVQGFVVDAGKAGRAHRVGRALVEAGGDPRVGVAPLGAEACQALGEEVEARSMEVGVGEGDSAPFDLYD
jgi:hypothetical protein